MRTFSCDTCGKQFTVTKWVLRVKHHFCSRTCYGRFRSKKLRPWNAGKHGTQIAWNKGLTKELVPSLARPQGPESPHWRGGLSRFRDRLEHGTLKYRDLRAFVFRRDNHTCQLCGKRGTTIHLDHIKPFQQNPELFFDPSNCRTVCVTCHKRLPTYGNPKRKRA